MTSVTKILVVDDEIIVRIGLKTIIPMETDLYEIVGEASNGKEALAILDKTSCDIVLTDIRMPEMDGLELLKQIHEKWPHIRVLILSNYEDFQYVQTALRLGAVEYIVKLEIEPAELLNKLRVISEKLDLERIKSTEVSQLEFRVSRYAREVAEKRLRELLLRRSSKQDIDDTLREFGVSLSEPPYSVAAVQIDHYKLLLDTNRFRSERLLNFTVANVLSEILQKYGNGELVEMEAGRFAILKESISYFMLEEMQNAVNTFLQISLSIGISLKFHQVYDLQNAYLQACEALEFRFYLGISQIINYDRLPQLFQANIVGSASSENWLRYIDENNGEGLKNLIADWVHNSKSHPVFAPGALREQWIRLTDTFAYSLMSKGAEMNTMIVHEGKYPYSVIRGAETLTELYDWFVGWIGSFLEYKNHYVRKKWRSEIEAVIKLIKGRLHLPLRISELASEVGFTENYLSILFKKETGETITGYITRIRINKARELLQDSEYKIYEISELVGYSDPNYFSRIFKQVEGMYPSEFRKIVTGQSV